MIAHPLSVIFSSFFLVAISEMGDKTQLLAFALATRFKTPWTIMAGILTATLLNHGLASWGGSWVSDHIPDSILRWLLSATFIGFGLWILIPDKDDQRQSSHRFGPFLTTTVSFFLAEMGDKTQLATVALGARFQSVVAVTIGTTLGMLVADGFAVLVGEKFADKIPLRYVRWSASASFIVFGLVVLLPRHYN